MNYSDIEQKLNSLETKIRILESSIEEKISRLKNNISEKIYKHGSRLDHLEENTDTELQKINLRVDSITMGNL